MGNPTGRTRPILRFPRRLRLSSRESYPCMTSVRSIFPCDQAQIASRTASPGASPAVTFSDGSHGLGPADFGVIYNVAGSGMTGTGVTIGVIARTNISSVNDVDQFRSIFGLTQNDPQIILNGPDPGVVSPDEEGEAVLDATWSGAVAPNATVKLVVSESTNAADGIFLSEFYIIDNNLADVMTESFISCEAHVTSNEASAIEFVAEQAAAQGITYLVASGDSGPDSCDNQTMIPATDSPASVNVLASTPFTIAVGGTEFNDTANPSQVLEINERSGCRIGNFLHPRKCLERELYVQLRAAEHRSLVQRGRSKHNFPQAIVASGCCGDSGRKFEVRSGRSRDCGRPRRISSLHRWFVSGNQVSARSHPMLCGIWRHIRIRSGIWRHHGLGRPEDRRAAGASQLCAL